MTGAPVPVILLFYMTSQGADCDACACDYVRWVRVQRNGGLCDVCGRDACVTGVPYAKPNGDGEPDGDAGDGDISTDAMSDASTEYQEIDDVFSGVAGEYLQSNIG